MAFAHQMRNAVAHGYFKVDLEIVRRTIHNDLSDPYEQLKRVLENLQRSGDGKRKG